MVGSGNGSLGGGGGGDVSHGGRDRYIVNGSGSSSVSSTGP